MKHKQIVIGVLIILLFAGSDNVSASVWRGYSQGNRAQAGLPGLTPAIPSLFTPSLQQLETAAPGWQQVNNNPIFGGAQTREVSALEVFNGRLYAATSNAQDGAQIFRSQDGTTWAPVTQPGFGIGHDIRPPAILDMVVFRERLYASTGRGDGPGQIWRSGDGTIWAAMVNSGFGNPDTVDIPALVEFNGILYAGVNNLIAGAQVWRSLFGDNNVNSWKQVAPATPVTATSRVTGLVVFNGALYALIESAGPAQLWRSNGSTWTTVMNNGFGTNRTSSTGSMAEFMGYLYAGAGDAIDGAQLWRSSNGSNWEQVINPAFKDPNNQKVEMVFVYQNLLYASMKNGQTGIELWRSVNGTQWEQVNQDGFGDSNNTGTNGKQATAQFLGDLYVGTTNLVDGGELWRLEQSMEYLFIPFAIR